MTLLHALVLMNRVCFAWFCSFWSCWKSLVEAWWYLSLMLVNMTWFRSLGSPWFVSVSCNDWMKWQLNANHTLASHLVTHLFTEHGTWSKKNCNPNQFNIWHRLTGQKHLHDEKNRHSTGTVDPPRANNTRHMYVISLWDTLSPRCTSWFKRSAIPKEKLIHC